MKRWIPVIVGAVIIIVLLCLLAFLPSGGKSTSAETLDMLLPVSGEYRIGGFIDVSWKPKQYPDTYWMSVDLVDGPISGLGHLWTFTPVPAEGKGTVPLPVGVAQGGQVVQVKPGTYRVQVLVYDDRFCHFDCPATYVAPHLIARGVSEPITLLPYQP